MIRTVKYQVAIYSGEVQVVCDEDDDSTVVIAKAQRIVARQCGGDLPFGYQSWKIM